jgi:hypothetical protein
MTMPPMARTIVAAKTSHVPHCRWGTKIRTSVRNARRLSKKVGSIKIRSMRRYLGERAGE